MNTSMEENLLQIKEWQRDIFLFCEQVLGMRPAEPIDELKGLPIKYKGADGKDKTTILFDNDGRLVYHNLSYYKQEMFKNQTKSLFKRYKGTRLTWQQTVKMEAYNRGIQTFRQDAYDIEKRWVTTRSGHGTGKTSSSSIIAIHFLTCFFGAQIGVTANTEDQLKDIFLKELYVWKERMPDNLKDNVNQLDDFVRIEDTKDWFLRARVARPEKPEAIAGLHGEFVLIIVDEASAVHNRVFEVMKGALTGENYIVFYDSNPTRAEGEFYDSHKEGSLFTRLHFNSRHSPIVKDGYIEKMEADYGHDSDEVKIRVDGDFAGVAEMDEKGWIPLFANVNIHFETVQGQTIKGGVIGVDPAGKGRDSSLIGIRDHIYLKELLNENTSNEIDLARKIETLRDAYSCLSSDIGIEAFGIGAKVVANVRTKNDGSVMAVLTDKPREEVKDKYHTYRSELAWNFRQWVHNGGIIITNNKAGWIREMEKIKYRRDSQGRIELMGKVEFKKEYGFSPDRFDMACMTFFKNEPTRPVTLTKEQLEQKENVEFLKMIQQQQQAELMKHNTEDYSCM